MSFKKYIASKDTNITNAYKPDMTSRAVDSNTGLSDSLELFSIYGQATAASVEKSRILIDFPINNIIEDRSASKIPSSGSVKFYLKLSNVEHQFSLPKDYKVMISPVSKSWDEGYGLDLDTYSDEGYPNGYGTTWLTSSSGSAWESQGGDVLSVESYDYNFYNGTEDLELDLTSLVEKWIDGSISKNGLLIKLSGSYEDGSRLRSFFTKRFSARGSEYYFKRPCIEARWESLITDDRMNFYASSSLMSPEDNKMNIYFYNKVNGRLKNIYNNITPDIKFFTDLQSTNEIIPTFKEVSNPYTGVYRAVVAVDTTASIIYDNWYNGSTSFYKNSIEINDREFSDSIHDEEYILNITNLKSSYLQDQYVTFKLFCRQKNWSPNIYSVASEEVENLVLNNLYYKIFRLNDNYTIVDYSTGSLAYTKVSYDKNGNYFDLDMKIFEKDYSYGIKFGIYDGSSLKEVSPIFKFRVE